MKPTLNETVAVIGLGRMGAAMAQNIQDSAETLAVCNRTRAMAQPFVERGARLAETPRDAASGASIVLSSLMDDTSVRDMVMAPDGILAGLKQGAIHLCATTISPELAEELTELHRRHGSHFVSGTVIGRPESAAADELITLLSGDDAAVARCKPVCDCFSVKTIALGNRPGLANLAKLSINYFAASRMELMRQIYAFGDAVGIDRGFYGKLFDSSFSNPTLKLYAAKIRDRGFHSGVGFELTGGLKDVKLMADASARTSQSFDFAPIIIDKMEQAVAQGLYHSDWSVLTKMSGRKCTGAMAS